ncbi:MAG: type II toxin-antitoxin system VapC family toxin [Elusimicrobiota bacterium]
MPLELHPKSKIFVDANIFIYYFATPNRFEQSCTNLFLKFQDEQLFGYTSVSVILETLHRLMVIEASTKISSHALVSHLKNSPALVKHLHNYSKILEIIPLLNIKIISATMDDLLNSIKIKEEHGLLTNDSLIVALMQKQNIEILATNDLDFDRIKFLHIWKPSTTNL